MSDLPPQPNSGSNWTTETLRQHVVDQLAARDREFASAIEALHRELQERDLRYQQRYDAQTQALEAARLAAAKANEVALSAAEKAVDKAETAAGKRFESVNEFRAQLSDQAQTFILTQHSDERIKALESSGANLQGRLWALGAIIAFVVIAVNVAIRFVQ